MQESTNYCATPEPESYQNPKVVPDLECPEGCYIHSKFNITDIVDKKGKTFSLNKFEVSLASFNREFYFVTNFGKCDHIISSRISKFTIIVPFMIVKNISVQVQAGIGNGNPESRHAYAL